MSPEVLERINTNLKERYGMLEDQPTFRVAWTSDQFEDRYGVHEIWYGGIYLRTEAGVLKCKKYPYKPDRWVLEKRIANIHPEIVGAKASYEPVWIFDDEGEYMEPTEKMINFLVYMLLFYPRRKRDLAAEELAEEQKEYQEIYQELDEEFPELIHGMVHGSASFMDSQKQKAWGIVHIG